MSSLQIAVPMPPTPPVTRAIRFIVVSSKKNPRQAWGSNLYPNAIKEEETSKPCTAKRLLALRGFRHLDAGVRVARHLARGLVHVVEHRGRRGHARLHRRHRRVARAGRGPGGLVDGVDDGVL